MLEHCGLYIVCSSHQWRDNITAVTPALVQHSMLHTICLQRYICYVHVQYCVCCAEVACRCMQHRKSVCLLFLPSTSCCFAVWPNEAKVLDTHQPDYQINRDRQTIEDKEVLRCVDNLIKHHTCKQPKSTSQLLSGNWKCDNGIVFSEKSSRL